MSSGESEPPRDPLQRRLLVAQRLVTTLMRSDFSLGRQLAQELVSSDDGADAVVILAWYSAMLVRAGADAEGVAAEAIIERIGSSIARRGDTGPPV